MAKLTDVEDYGLVVNPYDDCGFDGHMFKTYGQDFEFVSQQPVDKVWTMVDGDDGQLVILAGLHRVNAVGHLVSKIPHNGDEEFVIA